VLILKFKHLIFVIKKGIKIHSCLNGFKAYFLGQKSILVKELLFDYLYNLIFILIYMAKQIINSLDAIQFVNQNDTPKITILDELKYFIPPLQPEEWNQLQSNILAEGCRQALFVWKTFSNVIDENAADPLTEVNILIDGHNRYEICLKHGLDFLVQFIDFESLQMAKNYMIEQQLGRRNLNPEQMAYLRGLRYNQDKLSKGKYERKKDSSHNDYYEDKPLNNSKTIHKIADLYQVSPKTIQRDAEFAQGLDKLTLGLRQDVLSGLVKVSKKDIQKLAKTPLDTPISSAEELIKMNQVPHDCGDDY
jgi:hypothetical protein